MSDAVTILNPASASPAGMYSHVAIAEAGRLAFIAGQLALDARGELIAQGEIAGQIPAVYDSIGRILKDLGTGFSSVVQFTTYVVGPVKLDAFQKGRAEVYARIFPDKRYPPNTLLVISGLARPGALLEVAAIARLPD